ncbi:MAG: hypothetical protein H8D22_01935 [Candidatus Cloacimonetes bacterium]|nr:hypothetical protein [Candidatus Cloacimonadota bacterium]
MNQELIKLLQKFKDKTIEYEQRYFERKKTHNVLDGEDSIGYFQYQGFDDGYSEGVDWCANELEELIKILS